MAKKKVSNFRKKLGKKAKESLMERTKASYNTKDGGGFKTYISDDCKLPQFYCKEGDHCIDIIPFIAGPDHPNVEEGNAAYNIDVWAHTYVGPNKRSVLCPARNFDKKCPICEAAEKLQNTEGYDEQALKALFPKRRVVYYIVCYDNPKEEAKGVQVWESSHYTTEANIIAVSRNRRTGGYDAFADPDNGKTIEFEKKGKGVMTRFEGYKLLDRDEPISDEILDQASIPLDEFLEMLSYEEIKAIALLDDDEDMEEEVEDDGEEVDSDDEDMEEDDEEDNEDDDNEDDDEEEDDDEDDEEVEDLIEDLSFKEKKKLAKIMGVKVMKKESKQDKLLCEEEYEDVEEAIEEMNASKTKVVKKRKKK